MRINESLVKYLKNLKKFTKTQLSFSNYIIPIKPVCFTIGFINKTKINLDIINPKVIDDVLISMKDEAPNTNLFLVWNRFGIAQIVRELSSIDEFFTSGKFAILNVKPGQITVGLIVRNASYIILLIIIATLIFKIRNERKRFSSKIKRFKK